MLQRVKQSVANVGGTILGVVLNNVDVRHDQHYEYYTSYYNYYHSAGKGDKRKAARKKAERAVASAGPEKDTSDDAY
jgi:hypothetical protein